MRATISTHALTWSATVGGSIPPNSTYIFQLTRSRGARRVSLRAVRQDCNFNSRAHVERDRATLHTARAPRSFQLTRSRGARLVLSIQNTSGIAFQLTRSRGARPGFRIGETFAITISTHALTWSATRRLIIYQTPCMEFQLTRSRGARLWNTIEQDTAREISTHALTWSATEMLPHVPRELLDFNSRAHVERDAAVKKERAKNVKNFNSRAHVERDGLPRRSICTRYYFNSRAHVERDQVYPARPAPHTISTHALTWSATTIRILDGRRARISTHALTWSATRAARLHHTKSRDFNSRAHVERDRRVYHVKKRNKKFQLTRSRGARRRGFDPP